MVQVLDNLPGGYICYGTSLRQSTGGLHVMLHVVDNLPGGYICYGTSLRQSTGGLHMLWYKS